jgi:16S rRNA (adenine1518-N6/adenine1519-N6)-dimethyltransferase
VVLPPLREVIRCHDLGAKKSLGQHFLLDLNYTRRIVRTAPDLAGRWVYEVGPGPGGLTRAILESDAAGVVAVERDERCLAALEDLRSHYPDRLKLVAGDALTVDEAGLFGEPATVIANLPYNVATALLFKWLDRLPLFRSFTLMFQREVAERICAGPRTKAYGRLSVMTQWRCRVERVLDVPASVFVPPPRVASAIVRLVPLPAPIAPAPPELLAEVVARAFQHRRKMLRAGLRSLDARAEAILLRAGIDGTRRAEELSVAEFCRIATVYSETR